MRVVVFMKVVKILVKLVSLVLRKYSGLFLLLY